jgi:hypothetical protein
MATTSQKIIEIRFFVRIRGALTPPPRIDEPVMKMPLQIVSEADAVNCGRIIYTRQLQQLINLCTNRCLSLPTHMEKPTRGTSQPIVRRQNQDSELLRFSHTSNASPLPVKSISNKRQCMVKSNTGDHLTSSNHRQRGTRPSETILKTHLDIKSHCQILKSSSEFKGNVKLRLPGHLISEVQP